MTIIILSFQANFERAKKVAADPRQQSRKVDSGRPSSARKKTAPPTGRTNKTRGTYVLFIINPIITY